MKKIFLVNGNISRLLIYIKKLKNFYDILDTGYVSTIEYKFKKGISPDLLIVDPEIPILLGELETNKPTTGIVWFEKIAYLKIPVLFWPCNKEYIKEIEKLKLAHPGNEIHYLEVKTEVNHLLTFVNSFFEKQKKP